MRAYGLRPGRGTHPVRDGAVVTVVAALVCGVWLGGRGVWLVCLISCLLACAIPGIRRIAPRRRCGATGVGAGQCGGHQQARSHRHPAGALPAAVVVALCGWALGARAWEQTQPRHLGDYTGWVQVAVDPAPYGAGLRVTIEVEGERFDLWAYGGRRARLAEAQVGEFVWVQGERRAFGPGVARRRAAVRHVVGRFTAEVIGDRVAGSAFARSSNRVRDRLRDSAERTMSPDSAALFTGLVIGDDARQSPAMVADFRTSGLSHLTAVSGQNVAFVLAAALPVLRRLPPWWRWAGTIGTVGWFMAITRFEPSVLRAGVMAGLAATAFVLGRQVSPVRLLALAVGGLVVIDPLLVWSVGFWLSVGATAGVCLVGPWLGSRLPGPAWLRLPLAISLGAQAGVALPSLLVFGRLPLVSPLANLAAVPVAALVMLYGLPAGLLAPALPAPVCSLVMAPNSIGTRWVATVASVGAAVEPSPGWSTAGWLLLIAMWGGWRLVRYANVGTRWRSTSSPATTNR